MGQAPELGVELGPQLVGTVIPRPTQVQCEFTQYRGIDLVASAHRRSLTHLRSPRCWSVIWDDVEPIGLGPQKPGGGPSAPRSRAVVGAPPSRDPPWSRARAGEDVPPM